ncbi:hypothetical protein [Thorsellia anophelis]|uniref:Uncharacterized protein n=1 Tax=Thorsellia anophelis DSM 18579 TaxID=1123402 RepID=A0A1I0D6H1_9GAMM|nr:hypothetical protein [Thorsellia anophelis]SET27870.1 hypothetical protein SAMN02583745_01871 [Thorsellia anophelis DSM 18579]
MLIKLLFSKDASKKKPEKKERSSWKVLKMLIRLAILVYDALRFFEGDE